MGYHERAVQGNVAVLELLLEAFGERRRILLHNNRCKAESTEHQKARWSVPSCSVGSAQLHGSSKMVFLENFLILPCFELRWKHLNCVSWGVLHRRLRRRAVA